MSEKNIHIPTKVLLQEGLREYFRLLAEEAQQQREAALREQLESAHSYALEMV
jgi:hypothetical protein